MALEQISEEKDDANESPVEPVPRLCSEIQLFDLCDLEKCKYKSANFCTNDELLTRFERIADVDAGSRMAYSDDDMEEDDEYCDYCFGDDDGRDDYADEEDF
jgi:hypothetical protein